MDDQVILVLTRGDVAAVFMVLIGLILLGVLIPVVIDRFNTPPMMRKPEQDRVETTFHEGSAEDIMKQLDEAFGTNIGIADTNEDTGHDIKQEVCCGYCATGGSDADIRLKI